MIDLIKKYFASKKAKKNTSIPHTKTFNMMSVATIGVLFNAHSQTSTAFLLGLLKAIKPYGVKLAVLGYDKQKGKTESIKVSYIPYSGKDFGLFGSPKAEHLNSFTDKKFDVLIDLSIDAHFSNVYLARESKAQFKVGINRKEDFFDFMFTLAESPTENPKGFTELFEYLKKINNQQSV